MTAVELIEAAERYGGQLTLRGTTVVCRIPKGVDDEFIRQLKQGRDAIAKLLRLGQEQQSDKYVPKSTPTRSGAASDAVYPASSHAPRPFRELVCRWLVEACVTVGCYSNPHILNREFSLWAGFDHDAGTEDQFLAQLALLGFCQDEGGMIQGVCLASDFAAVSKIARRSRR